MLAVLVGAIVVLEHILPYGALHDSISVSTPVGRIDLASVVAMLLVVAVLARAPSLWSSVRNGGIGGPVLFIVAHVAWTFVRGGAAIVEGVEPQHVFAQLALESAWLIGPALALWAVRIEPRTLLLGICGLLCVNGAIVALAYLGVFANPSQYVSQGQFAAGAVLSAAVAAAVLHTRPLWQTFAGFGLALAYPLVTAFRGGLFGVGGAGTAVLVALRPHGLRFLLTVALGGLAAWGGYAVLVERSEEAELRSRRLEGGVSDWVSGGSFTQRLREMEYAWTLAVGSPYIVLVGYGPGRGFSGIEVGYRRDLGVERRTLHNRYAHYAFFYGLPDALLVVFFLLGSVARALRGLFRQAGRSAQRRELWAVVVGCFVYTMLAWFSHYQVGWLAPAALSLLAIEQVRMDEGVGRAG